MFLILDRKISENPTLDLGKFPGKDIEIVFRKFALSSIGRHFSFIFRNISPTSINPKPLLVQNTQTDQLTIAILFLAMKHSEARE